MSEHDGEGEHDGNSRIRAVVPDGMTVAAAWGRVCGSADQFCPSVTTGGGMGNQPYSSVCLSMMG